MEIAHRPLVHRTSAWLGDGGGAWRRGGALRAGPGCGAGPGGRGGAWRWGGSAARLAPLPDGRFPAPLSRRARLTWVGRGFGTGCTDLAVSSEAALASHSFALLSMFVLGAPAGAAGDGAGAGLAGEGAGVGRTRRGETDGTCPLFFFFFFCRAMA